MIANYDRWMNNFSLFTVGPHGNQLTLLAAHAHRLLVRPGLGRRVIHFQINPVHGLRGFV